jgi:hypothetical protein
MCAELRKSLWLSYYNELKENNCSFAEPNTIVFMLNEIVTRYGIDWLWLFGNLYIRFVLSLTQIMAPNECGGCVYCFVSSFVKSSWKWNTVDVAIKVIQFAAQGTLHLWLIFPCSSCAFNANVKERYLQVVTSICNMKKW